MTNQNQDKNLHKRSYFLIKDFDLKVVSNNVDIRNVPVKVNIALI